MDSRATMWANGITASSPARCLAKSPCQSKHVRTFNRTCMWPNSVLSACKKCALLLIYSPFHRDRPFSLARNGSVGCTHTISQTWNGLEYWLPDLSSSLPTTHTYTHAHTHATVQLEISHRSWCLGQTENTHQHRLLVFWHPTPSALDRCIWLSTFLSSLQALASPQALLAMSIKPKWLPVSRGGSKVAFPRSLRGVCVWQI